MVGGRPVSSPSFSFCFASLSSHHRVGATLQPHRPRLGFSFCSLLLSSVHTKDPDVATLSWWQQKVYQCLRVNGCCDHLHAVCLERSSEAATTEPYRFCILRLATMQSHRQTSTGGSWLTNQTRADSFTSRSSGV